MNLKYFPKITTERLILRKIEETDAARILFLRSDITINKFIDRPESTKTKNVSDALKVIKKITEAMADNTSVSWGITLKNKPEIIGSICLWNFSEDSKTAEVGYDLNPIFQRKGIMSEALKSVVHFGFRELQLERIEAITHLQNENSKMLLIKNGFSPIEVTTELDSLSDIKFEIKNKINIPNGNFKTEV
ncbi:MAG: GNAT family N-acetyltransferase [Flavobacteriaceae bacterium]|nr:GNAT family N-acetyltransferase [Flavobacteriaceae bacterium]